MLNAGKGVFFTLELLCKNRQKVRRVSVVFGFHPGQHPIELIASTTSGGRKTVGPQLSPFPAPLSAGHTRGQGRQALPIQTSVNRELGILRRYRVTPLRPLTYFAADVASYWVMALAGMALLVVVGKLVYDVRFEGNILSVLAGFTLGTLAFLAIGFVIASLAPSARVAQTVGMVLSYPMMFLCGATIPSELLPSSVQRIADFLPLTYVVKLMRGLWVGEPWSDLWLEATVLTGILVICGAISARFFRWE